MRLAVRPLTPGTPRVPALVVGMCEGDTLESLKLPPALRRPVRAAMALRDVTGRRSQITVVYAEGVRVLLAGLGGRKEVTPDVLRDAAVLSARRLQSLRVSSVAVWLPSFSPRFGGTRVVEPLSEGLAFGGYSFNPYRTRAAERATALDSLTFLAPKADVTEVRRQLESVAVVVEAVSAARDLANRPGNDLTPRRMAESAQAMARSHGLACRLYGPRELEKLGAGALLAVARGSSEEPRLIELDYAPRGRSRGTLVFVGKGITFDSGGISLKPAENMDRMKFDMCGAAAVLGAMQAIAELKPQVRVVGLVATCENMPGGKALKPGDVVSAMNGTTIEVTNTDAEGRLILADALSHAAKFKPDAVVDLATLTGAIVIALGSVTGAMFASDEVLSQRIAEAAGRTGERLWRMPLWAEYEELMRSDVADLKNASSVREAGACSAAIFLKRFTSYPWAHLDIAGVGHMDRDRPALPRGGTGFGVKTLVSLAMNWG